MFFLLLLANENISVIYFYHNIERDFKRTIGTVRALPLLMILWRMITLEFLGSE